MSKRPLPNRKIAYNRIFAVLGILALLPAVLLMMSGISALAPGSALFPALDLALWSPAFATLLDLVSPWVVVGLFAMLALHLFPEEPSRSKLNISPGWSG